MAGTNPRVTITDVAAASGVSRATVSFVLRDSPGQSISASTRERVRRAARDLGYVPHGIARALREGTSRIVVLTIDPVLDGNYARSYVAGLDAELAGHGHMLLVRYSHDHSSDRDAPEPEPDQRQLIDALSPRAVLRFGAPYLTGHELDDSGGGWRDGLAAHVAAQVGYLAGRGHTRIALALPDRDTPLRGVRQRFADQAAAALGLPPLAPFTLARPRSKSESAESEPADGTVAASSRSQFPPANPGITPAAASSPGQFLAANPGITAVAAFSLGQFLAANPGVTAVAAFDDDTALRVLAALRDLGLTAPADLAVIGFDDNGYGALTTPTLTTVHIDAEAHGRQAARAVLGLPADDLSPAPGQVVVRESA
jgi:Periplasmic binding protein-like domain/Bacterial regulatory proteins, lacI family